MNPGEGKEKDIQTTGEEETNTSLGTGEEGDDVIFRITGILTGGNLWNTVLTAAIVAAGLAALWSGLSHDKMLVFLSFLLMGLALVYIRYPNAWANIFWLALAYLGLFLGTFIMATWAGVSASVTAAGALMVFLSLWLSFGFLVHVKKHRDSMADIRYISLGIWGLMLAAFVLMSMLSGIGVWLWARGGGLSLYLWSEALIVILLPLLLSKAEETRSGFLSPGDLTFYERKEKCPECGAVLSIEHRVCPSCGKETVFKWCNISEAYTIICPSCKTEVLWRQRCSRCGERLPDEKRCPHCGASAPVRLWKLRETG
ncbi:MAG: hypothetical protein J7L61_02135 [Thermoplasmata archaeon]|nr:hypothetical protein [Thermoplasmata archaeon]